MNDKLLKGVSVILPVYNERECIETVVGEVSAVLARMESYEIVLVDDGSTDGTVEILSKLEAVDPHVRLVAVPTNRGQSAAMWTGFQVAKYSVCVAMDADGQNDPADIPRLLDGLKDADVCCGYRAMRKDTFAKRIGSRLANKIRRSVLHDSIRDTGCSLKAFKTCYVQRLQYWHGMHRFLPMLCAAEGATIAQIPVNHRERFAGKSKYTNFGRLMVTIGDLRGVRWLISRKHKIPYLPE